MDFKQISAHAWREEITIPVISGIAKSDTPRRKRLYIIFGRSMFPKLTQVPV
jgi:hypothetical protein